MRIDLFQQIRDRWVGEELWSGRLTTKSLSELSVTIHPAIGVVVALPPIPSDLRLDREALLQFFPSSNCNSVESFLWKAALRSESWVKPSSASLTQLEVAMTLPTIILY